MAKVKTAYQQNAIVNLGNQPKATPTKQKHIAPLMVIEERFHLHSLTQKELNKLDLRIMVVGFVKSAENFSLFNSITNDTVKLIDTSEEVCNMVALVLVNWLSSEHSYINEADTCKITVSFVSLMSEETGEVFTTDIEDDLFLEFSFTKSQAQTYLLNHIGGHHSRLVFENDTVLGIDCLTYKIVQGEFEYTI